MFDSVSASQNNITMPKKPLQNTHSPEGPNKEKPAFTHKTAKTVSVERQQEAGKATENEATLQTRTIRHQAQSTNSMSEPFLQWLKAKKPADNPSMDLANSTLKTILSYFKEHEIQIANLMTPEEFACTSKYNEKLALCCHTLVADCRQRTEDVQAPELSEACFLKYCQIPSQTHGIICDMAAMFAYKELYKQPEITPLLLGFRHHTMSHVTLGIFHGKSTPIDGFFYFRGSIKELGHNIHIVDPWLGFSCRAIDYPHFVATSIDHLNKQGCKLITDRTGEVTTPPFPNFLTNTLVFEVFHLPSLWKTNTDAVKGLYPL